MALRRSPNPEHPSQRGAVAVELALVLPIVVLLLVGMIEFGRAYHAKSALQGAVREGARVAALQSGDPVSTTLGAAGGLQPGSISVSTSGTPCTRGTPVSVTADYPFSYNIPFFGAQTVTLSATGVMRCERSAP